MCKIIVIPDASKIKDFEHFARYTSEILGDMPDGYGYAALGEQGQFGIRTLSPNAFAYNVSVPDFCVPLKQKFGIASKVIGPAMFHGRMSTNVKDLVNTHPITREGWNLIHNGVVTHHGEKYDQLTSNDSEHVLYNLISGGIEKVSENLTGYYAAAAIDSDGLLYVFRDAIASLFYAYSEKLETPIFATTENLIEDIGAYLGEELIAIKVKDNTFLVYDGAKLIDEHTFVSRGYDRASAALATKSLGHELSPVEEHYESSFAYENSLACDDAPSYREDSIECSWAERCRVG